MNQDARAASALFEEAVDWLCQHYGEFEFWVECVVVWTVQTRLRELIGSRSLPWGSLQRLPAAAQYPARTQH
jgi:hypothetical protein